ncbi:hypothetical protein DPMN_189945 [Dreissena polymorpha]|uniref:Uncharacterized protein n=1 Tax=Dreissena polymorpha TaxID=45954 RepID=A0A9D4DVT6_DREPO|nr:hypothetical protein DPMN_189945 [Dreissena polymorpha]
MLQDNNLENVYRIGETDFDSARATINAIRCYRNAPDTHITNPQDKDACPSQIELT